MVMSLTVRGCNVTRFLLAFTIVLVLAAGCGGPAPEDPSTAEPKPSPAIPAGETAGPEASSAPQETLVPESAQMGFIGTEGRRFIGPQGREFIPHGVNLVDKSAKPDNPRGTEAEFAAMREWGFNTVRLGFVWAGVEPEPGEYDEAYLKWIDARVQRAKANGLRVYLDMHQDLYGMKFSDGAPHWATLDEGKPHTKGSVWSDAYFLSEAVQTAFDNFWANKPGPDGVGIQDRYALAWKHIAKRYADEPAVIGYDLMNEPFIGSAAVEGQMLVMRRAAEVMAAKQGEQAPSAEELAIKWLTPEGRAELMALLDDIAVYQPALDAAAELFQEFERTTLTAMFQKVTDAIREVDTRHIILLETSISANMGIASGIEPVKRPDGQPDPLQAYCPHAYDLVTDTASVAAASEARLRLIFQRHGEVAERLDMPMIIGEWGAYGSAPALDTAWFVVDQIERLGCGDSYWEFGGTFAKRPTFPALNRPYPETLSGALLEYDYDPASKRFLCRWREDPGVKAPTRIYIPSYAKPFETEWHVNPKGAGLRIHLTDTTGAAWLIIEPTGEAVERHLTGEHP